MTSLDVWMLICMSFVAAALFEYALLLNIRYGKVNRISNVVKEQWTVKAEKKCRKVDRYAIRLFVIVHTITVPAYFYNVSSKSLFQ